MRAGKSWLRRRLTTAAYTAGAASVTMATLGITGAEEIHSVVNKNSTTGDRLLRAVEPEEFLNYDPGLTSQDPSPSAYARLRDSSGVDSLALTPTPTTAKTLAITYTPGFTALANNGESVNLPGHHYAVALGAAITILGAKDASPARLTYLQKQLDLARKELVAASSNRDDGHVVHIP